MLLHEAANLTVGEPLGRRVHGEHHPAVGFLSRIREHDELAGHQLAAVVVAHGARHEEQLAGFDLALEERLARPGALQHAARVPQHRAEHAQPAPRGQDAGADHPPHARRVLSHLGTRQWGERGGVQVAVRRVIQQVAGAPDAQARQGLRAPRAHALQVLHGRRQSERHVATAGPGGGATPTPR